MNSISETKQIVNVYKQVTQQQPKMNEDAKQLLVMMQVIYNNNVFMFCILKLPDQIFTTLCITWQDNETTGCYKDESITKCYTKICTTQNLHNSLPLLSKWKEQ